jgi:hypothetical protein
VEAIEVNRLSLVVAAAGAVFALPLAACAPAPDHTARTAVAAASGPSECDELVRVIGGHDRAMQALSHIEGDGAAHAIAALHRLERETRDTGEALRAVASTRADLRDARGAYQRATDDATHALGDEAGTLRKYAVDSMPLALKLEEAGGRLAQTCDKGHTAGCPAIKGLLAEQTDWQDPAKVEDLLDRLQSVSAKNAAVEREKAAFVTRARLVLVRSEEATDELHGEQARMKTAADAMRGAEEKLAAACTGGAS